MKLSAGRGLLRDAEVRFGGCGGHDMCGGDGNLTADWLERGAAADPAEI